MNSINLKGLSRISLAALAVLVLFAPGFTRKVGSDEPRGEGSARGRLVVLKAEDRYFPARVPAPSPEELDRLGIQSVPFSLNVNPASCDGTLGVWPWDARMAFDYALSIWGVLITGDQTIEIDACWRTDMGPGVLGSSGANNRYRDFGSAPVAGTWYPVALANQLEGVDQNGDTAEMTINFNANYSWYYGLDGETPPGDYDFVTVVLHEVAHGLGFSGSMNWDDGLGDDECDGTNGHGCWGGGGAPAYPAAYDRWAVNGTGQTLINSFDNNSTTLGNQLISDNLFFAGPHAMAANGNVAARLFAPTVWNGGSSFSHLHDGTYDGTAHALMTHALAFGESAHHPGTITLGILEDIGWEVPPLAQVWVDDDAVPPEDGTFPHPFDTVTEGAHAVYPGGIVWTMPGTYVETLTIYRPMELRSFGSVEIIGAEASSPPESKMPEEGD
jgi:hypothetical protein